MPFIIDITSEHSLEKQITKKLFAIIIYYIADVNIIIIRINYILLYIIARPV